MPLPANGKSILMTPDPYHTPGYGGFCPQFKYQFGETFGRTTNKLLQDKDVSSSGKLVLADIRPVPPDPDPRQDPRTALLRARTHSWGDQKLIEQMVPGYTGFIPRSEHYFGNRYALNCRSAITDFERDHRSHLEKIKELRLLSDLQAGKMDMSTVKSLPPLKTKYLTPLRPVAAEPKPYTSPQAAHHSVSPYYMANDDRSKMFMSGYTGFVPRSRPLIGMGYPIITHNALNDFTDDTNRLSNIMKAPVKIERRVAVSLDPKHIYPVETGLVPHYTGHIPGQKFRYGETFGHSTQNPLKLQSREHTAVF